MGRDQLMLLKRVIKADQTFREEEAEWLSGGRPGMAKPCDSRIGWVEVIGYSMKNIAKKLIEQGLIEEVNGPHAPQSPMWIKLCSQLEEDETEEHVKQMTTMLFNDRLDK